MANLTITVSNIDWVSGPKGTYDAAETITAGDLLYQATSTTVGVAANSDTAKDTVIGIALNDGTTGHPITYAKENAVVGFGAILTVGVYYVLSTAGLISPMTDAATSDYMAYIGYGLTTSNMKVKIVNTGLQHG
jgi:hypothetical protein